MAWHCESGKRSIEQASMMSLARIHERTNELQNHILPYHFQRIAQASTSTRFLLFQTPSPPRTTIPHPNEPRLNDSINPAHSSHRASASPPPLPPCPHHQHRHRHRHRHRHPLQPPSDQHSTSTAPPSPRGPYLDGDGGGGGGGGGGY
ncbi:hypothetical protein I7I51_05138, partial [Histoplasma capsulatum]